MSQLTYKEGSMRELINVLVADKTSRDAEFVKTQIEQQQMRAGAPWFSE